MTPPLRRRERKSWIRTRYIEAFFEESADGEPPDFVVTLVGTDENIDKAIKAIGNANYEVVQSLDAPTRRSVRR